jgi:hypothetical protein
MLRSCAPFAILLFGVLCASTLPTIATAVAQTLTVEEQQLADSYFSDCAKDWDTSTHMTRMEWERTCRRVATERARFRIQQSTEPRSKQN